MQTKKDLELVIADLNANVVVLGDKVSVEADQVKASVAALEGKILQLQTDASIPVSFEVEVAAIKAASQRLEAIGEAISGYVPDAPVEAPVEGIEAPVLDEYLEVEDSTQPL